MKHNCETVSCGSVVRDAQAGRRTTQYRIGSNAVRDGDGLTSVRREVIIRVLRMDGTSWFVTASRAVGYGDGFTLMRREGVRTRPTYEPRHRLWPGFGIPCHAVGSGDGRVVTATCGHKPWPTYGSHSMETIWRRVMCGPGIDS